MTGKSVFEQLMKEIVDNRGPQNLRITEEQFADWQKIAAWDIVQGLRYGQSFCNHFGITDNLLYYEFSWLNAEAYIRRAYLEKS